MILFDAADNFFYIHTENTTYAMAIRQSDKSLMHLYWGRRLEGKIDTEIMNNMDGVYIYEPPFEYSTYGTPDMRIPSLDALTDDGTRVVKLTFKEYSISSGKPQLKGLPATYSEEKDNVQTLEITLTDEVQKIDVILRYTSFYDYDAIARNAEIINHGKKLHLNSVMSATVDFYNMPKSDFVTLDGAWTRERMVTRRQAAPGNQNIESRMGGSGHMHNPFIAVCGKDALENRGDVFGFSLVYSGSFTAGIELNHYNSGRAYIGINPFHFDWILENGESFQSPEAVLVYSADGFGGMSRIFHRLYRERLCRGKYRDAERPIVINNWEATYFNFNEEKILNIAKKAAEIGVDVMVLDDGWFGKRDSDNCSLGDWYEDRNKLPDGLKALAEKINALGLGFGLWFEPEMVSPDSELYRAHPDWKLCASGREGTLKRNQYILDLSRREVCEYIYNSVSSVLRRVNIKYVKWDMNRFMTEVGSALLPPERQGEVMHRYMLGLYGILDRIVTEFPHILFESCAGGGGRFDPGMLYYMPQTWVSDDTDAKERLYIQHGTSMVYPYSAMGCHVSSCPNHQIGRTTPFEMRCNVALPGQFGFELDLNKCNDKELELAKAAVEKHRALQNVFHFGDCYRLTSPLTDDIAVTEFVSQDKNTVIVSINSIKPTSNILPQFIKLEALERNAVYKNAETGKTYIGEYLMNIGIQFKNNREHGTSVSVFYKE